MFSRYPTTALVVENLLELLYGIIASPISAVLLALLLVPLVISEKVPVIVSLSIVSAWVVFVIAAARTPAVRKLTLPRRLAIVLVLACVAFAASNLYKRWVLESYYSHHREAIVPTSAASSDKPARAVPTAGSLGSTDELVYRRLRELLSEQLQRVANSTGLPCIPGKPRVGPGPDAYKEVCDEDLGQMVIDEAKAIKDLANIYMVRLQNIGINKNNDSPALVRFSFNNDYNECCAQEVKQLRAAAVTRIGPTAKLVPEQREWERLFPAEASMSDAISPETQTRIRRSLRREADPSSIDEYASYLRALGFRLKRRAVPRKPSRSLRFVESRIASSALPYRVQATVETKTSLVDGFLVVEFNESPGTMGSDRELAAEIIDNKPLKDYLATLPYYTVVLQVRDTPINHDAPVHITSSSKMNDVHITKVTWFDE
jgi:hypothetical protein